MRYFLTTLTLLLSFVNFSQLSDDFSDLDFTNNPTWTGTTADFIINGDGELQLNALVAGTSYLATPHNLSTLDNQEWRFWTRISTAPSGSNFGRIYLTAASSDLSTNPDGFYLQLGEALSTDAVRLNKQVGGVSTPICASADGSIAASFAISIRVLRDNLGNWTLFVDPAGGEAFVQVGTGLDATNLLGSHLGYLCTYTSGNITRYYLDNVYAGNEIVDTEPPTVISVTAINANLIDVLFSEAVDPVTAENTNSYDIQPFNSAQTATVDGVNPALVHIVPTITLSNGSSYNLFTSGIEDLNGNPSVLEDNEFGFYTAETPVFGDVIINEFMCDQTPVVGLPEVEFVEIYNRSNKVFNLENWKLGDAASFGTVSNAWLLPGEYKILCATASLAEYPDGVGVSSFPSLNNTEDDIVLQSDLLLEIDKISYTDDWYNDPSKADGGYTIERINPTAPCSGIENWGASTNASGGTPGVINSLHDLTPDTQAPFIVQAFANSGSSIEITFNEGMDSTALADAQIITNPVLTETFRSIVGPFPSMMSIQFNEAFVTSQTYQLQLQNIADCWLNNTSITTTFALPDVPQIGDVVINEILFNPLTGGSDWVELYNQSSKLLNLKDWAFAKYENDTIGDGDVIFQNYLLYPGDYVVVGEDSTFVMQNYPAAIPGKFLQSDLPSYNTDSNTVYLLAPIPFSNNVMDKLAYSDDWHFRLLDDDKGKSLERIDFNAPTQDQNNWHTAAEAIGFATPGGENSQFQPAISSGTLSFTTESFSPDNDGFEDVLQINYELETLGLVGNMKIYDDRGRLVRDLMKSELLGLRGTVVWDGVTDSGTKASIGTYVIVFEAFQVNGGLEYTTRKAFVLAGMI